MELADVMAYKYGTRANPQLHRDARRNKYNMQEAIRKAGVRAITQQLCRSEDEVGVFGRNVGVFSSISCTNNSIYFKINKYIFQVRSFYASLNAKCVVKPNESAGSDSVYLCDGVDEALVAFSKIHDHVNGLGQVNDGALCQVRN